MYEISSKKVDLINDIWFYRIGTCVIYPINANKLLGIITSLLFMILNNFFSKLQAYSIKLMVLGLMLSSSFICVDRNFFISLLLFSQNSCKNLNILQSAFSLSSQVCTQNLSNLDCPKYLAIIISSELKQSQVSTMLQAKFLFF